MVRTGDQKRSTMVGIFDQRISSITVYSGWNVLGCFSQVHIGSILHRLRGFFLFSCGWDLDTVSFICLALSDVCLRTATFWITFGVSVF